MTTQPTSGIAAPPIATRTSRPSNSVHSPQSRTAAASTKRFEPQWRSNLSPLRDKILSFTIQAPSLETPSSSLPSAESTINTGSDSSISNSSGHRERGGNASPETSAINLASAGEENYELADYRSIQARKAAEDRDRRRQDKRLRKRQWLETQDEMKFSHSVQFNAVPDWSSHYIAYSNLKKL